MGDSEGADESCNIYDSILPYIDGAETMTEQIKKELRRIAALFGLEKATVKTETFYTKTLYYIDGLAVLAVRGRELWPYY